MTEPSSANSVGTQVTQILDEADNAVAELLAEADQRADRAGRDELTKLRITLEAQIENLGSARARIAELGEGTTSRLRAAAAQLAEMPARFGVDMQSRDAESFDHAFDLKDEAGEEPSLDLAALVKAADRIAGELTETARAQSKRLESAARREADRIGVEEPKRLARAYDPSARRAEQLRRDVEELNELLDMDVMGAEQTERTQENESAPDEWRRAPSRRRRRHRR